MIMEFLIKIKGETYFDFVLDRMLEKGSERYITPPLIDLITRIGVIAGAYFAYKMCCTAGKNRLPEIKPQKILYLENGDIVGRTKSTIDVLIDEIDQLETRDDLISWIIKYQSLKIPKAAEITDIVDGTAGCGLVTVLRMTLAAENLAITDDAPTKALIDTIKEMRNKNQLDLLIGTNRKHFRELQMIETRMHRKNVEGYDTIGKALTSWGVDLRTALCFAIAKNPSPTNISTAALGASRMLCGSFEALKSTGKWLRDALLLLDSG